MRADPVRPGRWPLLVILTLMLVGCGADQPPDPGDKTDRPVGRIITLAPHLTELMFTAGAGNRLVGVVEYSDFPAAALELPRIGDAFRLDYEVIVELEPDLILAWKSGTPGEVIERLEQLGFRVVALGTGSLTAVADNLRVIGQLTGTQEHADAVALDYEHALQEIRESAAGLFPLKVFYQVSPRPVLTISSRHVIGEAIELCGGINVFGDLPELTPSISPESVIDAAPEVIIAGRFRADDSSAADGLAAWRQWESIPAVRKGNLYLIDANLIARSSVRILDGVRELCAGIARAREQL
jgi:iron complex transport system substrate-binding protein